MNNNNEMPLKQIIDSALSKIGEVVDVNTVIGEPINLPGEVSIIPFSKVTVGFASGGAEYGGKNPRTDGSAYFAGGNGAGVSMVPLGFIAVEKGTVRVIELGKPETYVSAKDPINQALDGINGVIDKAPDLLAKLMALFGKNTEETVEAEMVEDAPAEETDIEVTLEK